MSQIYSPAEPLYAQLTAPGRGAVATILISSRSLSKDLGNFFRPASGKKILDCLGSEIIYGRWLDQGDPGEDLIVCPKTNCLAEIHCHGGTSAISAIIRTLAAHGYRPATEQELELIRGISPWKSDIEKAIQNSSTERTSLILLELFQSIDDEFEQLVALIRTDVNTARDRVRQALNRQKFGIHLTRPWSVVLVGKPNAGKSSLINAIVGFERAIVHATPGTTRDVIEQMTAINGWPVKLKDTAGLRLSTDQIELQGVTKARQEIANADLTLLIVDASEHKRAELTELNSKAEEYMVVMNKSDLESKLCPREGEFWTSAMTGEGVEDLIHEIGRQLVPAEPEYGLLPVNGVQVNVLYHVLKLLDKGEIESAVRCLKQRSI